MTTTDIIEQSDKLTKAWFWACIKEGLEARYGKEVIEEIEREDPPKSK